MSPRAYRSYADFEREEIRPTFRAGWSMDEIEQPNQQDIDFDVDPWEAALDAAEYEEDDEEDE
ncbi:MAG: transcriptional regulator [Polyangiaceae bacterium]